MNQGTKMMRWLTLGSLLAALASSQCGTTSSTSGTESHWLEACQGDASCGGLDCLCGVCTRPCDQEADCASLSEGALCTTAAGDDLDERCGGTEEVKLCTSDDTLPSFSSGGSTGTSSSTGSGGAGGEPAACAAETARGEGAGACETLVGVRWTGQICEPLWGCECVGADCDDIAPSYEECAMAHAECFDNDSCWDERHAVVDLLNDSKDCTTSDDCTSHLVGCGISEDGCTGATYSNLGLASGELQTLVGRISTCAAAYEADFDECSLCDLESAPPQCVDGRCGNGDPCALELSLLGYFVGKNEACETAADCVVQSVGCGFSEDGCTGGVYMTQGFDEAEFDRLRSALYACAGEDGACSTCDRVTTPAACISGFCRAAQ